MLSGFSWESDYHRYQFGRGRPVLSRFIIPGGFASPEFNYAVQRTIPSVRGCVTAPSPRRCHAGLRIFDRMSIGIASRLILRSRLTLIRLALIRNPWSFGGRVSRPPYRYLFLHLLFRDLQSALRPAFCGYRNAPLPIILKG